MTTPSIASIWMSLAADSSSYLQERLRPVLRRYLTDSQFRDDVKDKRSTLVRKLALVAQMRPQLPLTHTDGMQQREDALVVRPMMPPCGVDVRLAEGCRIR